MEEFFLEINHNNNNYKDLKFLEYIKDNILMSKKKKTLLSLQCLCFVNFPL